MKRFAQRAYPGQAPPNRAEEEVDYGMCIIGGLPPRTWSVSDKITTH